MVRKRSRENDKSHTTSTKNTKYIWEQHWNEKIGVGGNIKLSPLGITVES